MRELESDGRDGRASLLGAVRDRWRAVSWREVAINLGLICGSLLLVFAGFEGALRAGLIDYEGQTGHQVQYCAGPESQGAFHPTYGWTAHPNSAYLERRSRLDDWDYHEHNAAGFRDTDDSGPVRILVLGDSFMEGALVEQNATAAHRLDRSHPDAGVRNFALGGYGTGQSYLVYRNVSDTIEHDVVVLGFYMGNDMRNNVDDDPRRPGFEIRNGTLRQHRVPRNVTRFDRPGLLINHPAAVRVKEFLKDHFAVYNYLEPRVKSVLLRTPLYDPPSPPRGNALRRQQRLTKALLMNIDRAVGRNDASLYVYTIPPRGEIYPDNPHHYPIEAGQPYWDAQRRMFDRFESNASNTTVVDATSIFRVAADGRHRLYGRINGHMEAPAHRLLARNISDRLVSDGHIEPRTRPLRNLDIERETPTCP